MTSTTLAASPPMTPSDEEIVRALLTFVAEELNAGRTPSEIEQSLVEKGLDREAAVALTARVREVWSRQRSSQGSSTMLVGALWLVGGLVATAATYGAGGSSYVVFWGAIAYGGIKIVRGMMEA